MALKRFVRLYLLGIILWAVLSVIFSTNVHAQTIYCSFYPTSENLAGSGYEILTYNVEFFGGDTGDPLRWFKIEKISGGQDTQVVGAQASGWSVSDQTSASMVFSGNTMPVYGTGAFNIQLAIPPVEATVYEVWNMQASLNADGSGSQYCLFGEQRDSIIRLDPPEPDRPYISGVGVVASGESAQISWNTNIAATSVVNYGLDSGYGSTESSGSQATSHSITLTGLLPSTTYHYQVAGTASSGGYGYTFDNSFTTTSSPAVTTTVTTTTTTTSIVTVTPTPVPLERVPPQILFTTAFDEPFEQAPTISGRVTDNKGVLKIHYSTDGGQNWLLVDVIEDPGARSTDFEFTPLIFEDGNFEIQVRAQDVTGNLGFSDIETLVIDRLPPRVGGNLLSLGPHSLLPNKDGIVTTLVGVEQKMVLSAVGGPITVDLLINEQTFPLSKSPETGLWSGIINFEEPGIYQLTVKAVDGADNKTERKLNTVAVLPSGKVVDSETSKSINGAKVKIYYQDPEAKIWTLWDAKSFGQENPQKTNEEGNYQFFLPPGTYYLKIESLGHKKLTSKIFSIGKTTPLNADFELELATEIRLGPFVFYLPDFSGKKAQVKIIAPEIPAEAVKQTLVGKEAPLFSLPTIDDTFSLINLRGSPAILTFISTWSPPSLEQISVLDNLVDKSVQTVIVATQETISKLSIFQKRGNYDFTIVVDEDGELVEDYDLHSLPTHYLLDRRGIVKKVVTGVLDEEEIRDTLVEIR